MWFIIFEELYFTILVFLGFAMWKSCNMFYKCLFVFVFLIKMNHCLDYLEGWNYINLHCRDNDNKPVDWWYIYKPPVDVIPFKELGRNFTFITPDSMGRWQTSYHHITANSMLQHTLAPMFRPTYTEYLAVVAYEGLHGDEDGAENFVMGVLMADEKGGFWMGHTVPGLLDLKMDHPTFPESEAPNGHLLLCLSLDLVTLNDIAASIREMSPRFTRIQFPPRLRSHLPDFNYLNKPRYTKLKGTPPSRVLNFITQNKSLRARMLIRRPGDKNCLYNSFAKTNGLVLDIYGHRDHEKPFCQNDYSVRYIDSISIKGPDFVSYIRKGRDRTSFAVSTAAHWQRTGVAGLAQHWTCTSSSNDSTRGGMMLCADNYNVWLSFDNFKIKEPEC